jgi:hypothetical protein
MALTSGTLIIGTLFVVGVVVLLYFLIKKGHKKSVPSVRMSRVQALSDNINCPHGTACGNTCCPMADGNCCSDKVHCCPYGYSCRGDGSQTCDPQ